METKTTYRLRVGDTVQFVDMTAKTHDALVTAVWGPEEWDAEHPAPSINVVYVERDETKTDSYGRQIARSTSVVHEDAQPAHGMFWRFVG